MCDMLLIMRSPALHQAGSHYISCITVISRTPRPGAMSCLSLCESVLPKSGVVGSQLCCCLYGVYLPGDHSRPPPDIINIVIRLGQCTHSHHHHHQSQQNKVKCGTFLLPDICNYIRLLQNTFPQIRLYLLIIRRKNSFHKEGRIGLQVVQW